jgi:uncharacterized repeat protein (TIGR03809 family)
MADREFRTPTPRVADVPFRLLAPMRKWERVSLKWRALAEGRRAHFHDLYRSGRWKRYYTEEEFVADMRDAIDIAERWAAIAPLPEEREALPQIKPAEAVEQPKAA